MLDMHDPFFTNLTHVLAAEACSQDHAFFTYVRIPLDIEEVYTCKVSSHGPNTHHLIQSKPTPAVCNLIITYNATYKRVHD